MSAINVMNKNDIEIEMVKSDVDQPGKVIFSLNQHIYREHLAQHTLHGVLKNGNIHDYCSIASSANRTAYISEYAMENKKKFSFITITSNVKDAPSQDYFDIIGNSWNASLYGDLQLSPDDRFIVYTSPHENEKYAKLLFKFDMSKDDIIHYETSRDGKNELYMTDIDIRDATASWVHDANTITQFGSRLALCHIGNTNQTCVYDLFVSLLVNGLGGVICIRLNLNRKMDVMESMEWKSIVKQGDIIMGTSSFGQTGLACSHDGSILAIADIANISLYKRVHDIYELSEVIPYINKTPLINIEITDMCHIFVNSVLLRDSNVDVMESKRDDNVKMKLSYPFARKCQPRQVSSRMVFSSFEPNCGKHRMEDFVQDGTGSRYITRAMLNRKVAPLKRNRRESQPLKNPTSSISGTSYLTQSERTRSCRSISPNTRTRSKSPKTARFANNVK